MTAAAHALSPNRRKRNLDASPPPRHFHGPQSHSRLRQRLLRWPLLPPPPETKRPAFDMWNFISGLFGGRRPKDNGLEVFKRWCGALSRDLTVVTDEETGTTKLLLDRRVKDSRKAALEAVKPPQRQKTEPYYLKAHEEARRNDGRLEEIGIEVRLKEEKLAEIRKSDKAAQEDLSELFKPLTEEEKNEVHDCFHARGPSSKVLVLHEWSNIEVSKEKFQCLRPCRWLNDEVINLYLELLKEREKREPKRFLKCHFFNTFFYKKLACGKSGYDYKSVKRWTTHKKLGYGLIECDKIFVPVHKDVHWCLAIINMKENTFQYLDSLGGTDHNVLNMLARYIAEEVKDKSNKVIDTSSWHEEIVDGIPLQQNGWDCGMFMLKYIDFHSRGLSLSFSQEHMEYFRERTAKEILNLRAD
ncbi:putative ubiquitin-like-specific protease 1B [Panicum miliaceum]|uniref:Ubiquitin-like-specific protease 1B n=1 Tax=Panicum miliaceum TaxID=4540 RepID=A0A3L6TM89_PANMI|nr:putative ubiquitin-like-specific protease 1B [Panicum miliaceum]